MAFSLWLGSLNDVSTNQQLSAAGREGSITNWPGKASCFRCRCVFARRWQLSGEGTPGQPCSQPRSRAGLGSPALLSCQHIFTRGRQTRSTPKSAQITNLQRGRDNIAIPTEESAGMQTGSSRKPSATQRLPSPLKAFLHWAVPSATGINSYQL